jgi:hypothetical protein
MTLKLGVNTKYTRQVLSKINCELVFVRRIMNNKTAEETKDDSACAAGVGQKYNKI